MSSWPRLKHLMQRPVAQLPGGAIESTLMSATDHEDDCAGYTSALGGAPLHCASQPRTPWFGALFSRAAKLLPETPKSVPASNLASSASPITSSVLLCWA